MDEQKSPCGLQDFFPFRAAAQKAEFTHLDEVGRKDAQFAGDAIFFGFFVSFPPTILHLTKSVDNLAHLQVQFVVVLSAVGIRHLNQKSNEEALTGFFLDIKQLHARKNEWVNN